uniref:Uncharacterized protein n=1 Tax=Glossina austeni TaxID=7395 RepID=A0A1A9VXZ3_GLOAU
MIKHNPNKDPKFHQEEILIGAGTNERVQDKTWIVQKIEGSGRRKGTYFLRLQGGALKETLSNNGGPSTYSDVCVRPLTDLKPGSVTYTLKMLRPTCKLLEPGGKTPYFLDPWLWEEDIYQEYLKFRDKSPVTRQKFLLELFEFIAAEVFYLDTKV